jgi:hypothetical protein
MQDMVSVLSFLLLFYTKTESYQVKVSSSVSSSVLCALYQNTHNILNHQQRTDIKEYLKLQMFDSHAKCEWKCHSNHQQ